MNGVWLGITLRIQQDLHMYIQLISVGFSMSCILKEPGNNAVSQYELILLCSQILDYLRNALWNDLSSLNDRKECIVSVWSNKTTRFSMSTLLSSFKMQSQRARTECSFSYELVLLCSQILDYLRNALENDLILSVSVWSNKIVRFSMSTLLSNFKMYSQIDRRECTMSIGSYYCIRKY